MNEPIDHHYLPIFYLSRWTGTDEKLCRFSKPTGTFLDFRRVAPRGTAFEEHLYEFGRTRDGQLLSLEHSLFSRVDSDAAVTRSILELRGTIPHSDQRNRQDWSKFIVAQMMRAPEDIAQLKHSVAQEWTRTEIEIQIEYEKVKGPNDPNLVSDFLARNLSDHYEVLAHSIAERILVHAGISNLISSMDWTVMDFSVDCSPLFTSDRPVWTTTSLTEIDTFIWMPISPRALFLAAPDPLTIQRLLRRPRARFAKLVNELVVRHAVKYVFATDDRLAAFVRRHMSTRRHSTFLERLALKRGLNVLDPNSPSAHQLKER